MSPGHPGSGIGPGARLALALFLLGPALVCAQAMYKWVDEKGVTHFSEHPPADAKLEKKATKVTPKVTPSGNPSAYDPQAWKNKEADSKKRDVDRGQQERTQAKDAARRAETCDRARSRLAFLNNSSRIFRDNPDGTRTYMDDKEREAEVARVRQTADEACR